MIVGQALRDQQRELTVFRNRLMLSGLFIVLAFVILLARFSWLQVVQSGYYHTLAEQNRISVVPVVSEPRHHPRPQRHRARRQLLGLHAGSHTEQGWQRRARDRRPWPPSST